MIRHVQIVEHEEIRIRPDTFEFREDLKHHWLQRACLWVLRKLKCHARLAETVRVRSVSPDIQPIIEHVSMQRYQLIDQFDHVSRYDEELHLLIGEREWCEIMKQADLMRGPVSYPGQLFIGGGRFGRGRWMGMTVHVLPWMQGAIVVPTLESAR